MAFSCNGRNQDRIDPRRIFPETGAYIFSAPWCHPCHDLYEILQKESKSLEETYVVVSGMSPSAAPEYNTYPPFHEILDPGWVMFDQIFPKRVLPSLLVVEKQGYRIKQGQVEISDF